jgi:hypothetical protein
MVSGRNNLVGRQSFFNAINHIILVTVNVGIHYAALPFAVRREADEVPQSLCAMRLRRGIDLVESGTKVSLWASFIDRTIPLNAFRKFALKQMPTC